MILGASSCAHSCSSLFGMLSGPIALVMLMFFSSFWTPSGEISIGRISVLTRRVVGWHFFVVGFGEYRTFCKQV